MKKYNVNFELQSRVRKYLEYKLKNESNSQEESTVMRKLNGDLKKELIMESVGKIFYEIPFFKDNFTRTTIEKIVLSLKQINLNPDEYLIYVNKHKKLFKKFTGKHIGCR